MAMPSAQLTLGVPTTLLRPCNFYGVGARTNLWFLRSATTFARRSWM